MNIVGFNLFVWCAWLLEVCSLKSRKVNRMEMLGEFGKGNPLEVSSFSLEKSLCHT